MKITAVEAILFTARWTDDPTFPNVPHSAAFIRIDTDEGISGVGEALLGYFVPEAVPAFVDSVRPALLGRDPAAIGELWHELYVSAAFWGRSGAGLSVISGVEMALWDLKGKALGVPVYQLLGGAARDRVPMYASGGPSYWPPERTVEKVLLYRDKGYRAAKVSTGYYLEPDTTGAVGQRRLAIKELAVSELARAEADKLERLRAAVGPGFDLALDGHQAAVLDPISAKTALDICAAVEDAGLLLYEEPLAYTDVPGYALLRRRTRVPIAGGEMVSGVDGFARFLDLDALDIVQPDASWVGGIAVTQKVIAAAEARGVGAAIHTGGSAGPGFAASLHLAIASRSSIVLERVVNAVGVQNLLLVEPLEMVDGCLRAPTAPGLGIELRDDVLKAHPYLPGSGERD